MFEQWYLYDISEAVETCVILYNAIVEDHGSPG
jgi:hypothetical protein